MTGTVQLRRILSRATLMLGLFLAACQPHVVVRPAPMALPAPAGPAEETKETVRIAEPLTEDFAACAVETLEDPAGETVDAVAAAPPPFTPPPATEPLVEYPPLPPGYRSVASYYAKKFNGRRTCTGDRYDPEKLTAASNDLPLGSRALVHNPANGKEVTVRINDRPRKRSYPLIDLSRAAARELGFLGKGAIRVRVIPLDASPVLATTPP